MSLRKHIIRGLVEQYQMGLLSKEEEKEFESLLWRSEELQSELDQLEAETGLALNLDHDKEVIENVWQDVEEKYYNVKPRRRMRSHDADFADPYIKVHKHWRLVFFILSILTLLYIISTFFFFTHCLQLFRIQIPDPHPKLST
ncbi:MAG TPA: hypothetical protein VFV08_08655 [Puia sp.]|nr:hypothetical protein [Puia sp.]